MKMLDKIWPGTGRAALPPLPDSAFQPLPVALPPPLRTLGTCPLLPLGPTTRAEGQVCLN